MLAALSVVLVVVVFEAPVVGVFCLPPPEPVGLMFVILTVRVRKLPGGMPRGGAPTLLPEPVVPDVVSVVLLLAVVVVLLVVDSVVDVEEEEAPPVPVLVEPDIPLLEPPRAREDRAEATAAEAACARPPARLLFIAPIIGGVMDAGTIAVGSILFRASISEYSASISSLGGVVAVLEAVATPSSDIDSPATGRVSSTASVSMAPLSPLVSSA